MISLLIVVIGFIVYCILNSVAEKPINAAFEKEQKEMQQKQKKRLEEAEKADEDALTRQQEDCDAAYDAVIAKNQDKLDAMEAAQKEFNEITLLSQADLEKDLGLIKKVLELMEGSRADSVKEALQELDRRECEAEAARRAAEMARLEAERRERERLASMPGRLHMYVGSINTYSGNLQSVRNEVYVDGVLYGMATSTGSVIQLNPGPHTVFVKMLDAGYLFTTPSRSIDLHGNGDLYMKAMIKNAVPSLTVGHSESDIL